MLEGCEVTLTKRGDVEGILELQERNQPHQGGTLSARFPHAWFEAAIAAMPVVVVRRNGRVVGYLVSSPITAHTDVPVVQAMLSAYRGAPDAYVYGPICVGEGERGRAWRERCSRSCACGYRNGRAFCSLGATIRPPCEPTLGWA